MVKQLRARRKKLEKRAKRLQAIRARLRKIAGFSRRRGFKRLKGVAKAIDKRLEKRIVALNGHIKDLNQRIEEEQHQNANKRKEYLQWLRAQVGKDENDPEVDGWVHSLLGYGDADSIPWCSITVATGMKKVGMPLPSSIAYSGAWLTWDHGDRISYSERQEGDLLVFDWGDGGITDHVATYDGGDMMIGGNQRDTDTGGQVSRTPVPTSAIVGVVRPEW